RLDSRQETDALRGPVVECHEAAPGGETALRVVGGPGEGGDVRREVRLLERRGGGAALLRDPPVGGSDTAPEVFFRIDLGTGRGAVAHTQVSLMNHWIRSTARSISDVRKVSSSSTRLSGSH